MTEYRVFINPPESHNLEAIGQEIEADNPQEAQVKALEQQNKYPVNQDEIVKYPVVAIPESHIHMDLWGWNIDVGGWHK